MLSVLVTGGQTDPSGQADTSDETVILGVDTHKRAHSPRCAVPAPSSILWQDPTSPAQPRWRPPGQLRALHHRHRPPAMEHPHSRLHRPTTSRGQKPAAKQSAASNATCPRGLPDHHHTQPRKQTALRRLTSIGASNSPSATKPPSTSPPSTNGCAHFETRPRVIRTPRGRTRSPNAGSAPSGESAPTGS